MRGRHTRKRGGAVAQRARGGAIKHHPATPVPQTGEGNQAKTHAARRARGGTCWFCGRDHASGGVVKPKPKPPAQPAPQSNWTSKQFMGIPLNAAPPDDDEARKRGGKA